MAKIIEFFRFKLGVQNVEDLKHVLGTVEDSSSKPQTDDAKKQSNSRKSQSENLFYRDSSTFLKVFIDLHMQ